MGAIVQAAIAALADKVVQLLIAVGVIVFVLSIAGGVPNYLPIMDPVLRYVGILFGVVLVALGIYVHTRSPAQLLDGSVYGVKIISPRDGEKVNIVSVRGTIEKKPPDGYELMILRIYPNIANAFMPLKGVKYTSDNGWFADDCDIGGKTGESRALGAYLVGQNGQTLFEYFRAARDVHGKLRTPGQPFETLPLIPGAAKDRRKGINDIVMCTEVHLNRK